MWSRVDEFDSTDAQYEPKRKTAGSAGLDLVFVRNQEIPPDTIYPIDLRITFRFPPRVYGKLELRSKTGLFPISLRGGGVIGENAVFNQNW